MKIYTEEKLPIKSWCENPEEGCLVQARNIANLPFLFKHVALMPDTHQGYGMPIGGVIATKGVVIPNAVGVDIGCGMCAVKTPIKVENLSTELLKKIMGEIRKVVPVGFGHHQKRQDLFYMPYAGEIKPEMKIVDEQFDSATKQVGTLGGGNHFIEIQKGNDGFIWIMIHSGSRNIGLKVAQYYNDLAVKLNEKWHTSVPKEHELAFLPIDSNEGQAYLSEMDYCVRFALCNRRLMMDNILGIFKELVEDKVPYEDMINIAHNYASMENHFGTNVMVHRKGATLAREGMRGIIPGSQGTASYIVKGKGNPDSFMSCSHGAGRQMGRKEAERSLDLEAEIKMLNDQGVIHSVRNKSDLDEAPSAYKNIDIVMKEQQDLVEILVELKPLGVIKG
jgi:tRNA-splicing ligase RtcB